MKKRSLIILLALPTLLSGCSAFKKFIHPIDWFKTKILKIEDVTIDAQDLAELPDKMKSFTADILLNSRLKTSDQLFDDDSNDQHAILKFRYDDNGEARYSFQSYQVRTLEVTKLDLAGSFAFKYPGVAVTDELLRTYISLEIPSAKVETDGLTYKITYNIYDSIYTSGLFDDLSIDVDEKAVFAAVKSLCPAGYYGLKYNLKGKYYEPNNATEFLTLILSKALNMSMDYHLYFEDNLLVKIDGSFTEDDYVTDFVVNIYDIGNTIPDERTIVSLSDEDIFKNNYDC